MKITKEQVLANIKAHEENMLFTYKKLMELKNGGASKSEIETCNSFLVDYAISICEAKEYLEKLEEKGE